MDFQTFRKLTNKISKNLEEVNTNLEELANGHDFSESYTRNKLCEVDSLTSNSKNIIYKHNKNLSKTSEFYNVLDSLNQDLNKAQLKAYKLYTTKSLQIIDKKEGILLYNKKIKKVY
jgi:molecular chaperone GrpE (heat shock protein)